jgi:hypothetical protein
MGICASAAPANVGSRPVVVELFTSQGCSSCVAADAFMEELKSMKGVIAMSFNVDHWDYLGWHDTLADAAYSKRQYDYARLRMDGDVYTPQIIINASNHYVGSDQSAVRTAIHRAQAAKYDLWVPLRATHKGKELLVEIGENENGSSSTLWLIAIAPSVRVKILRGENAGREILYHNVVRNLMPGAMWQGEAMLLKFPIEEFVTSDSAAGVALLQIGNVGPVIGAAPWGALNSKPSSRLRRSNYATAE